MASIFMTTIKIIKIKIMWILISTFYSDLCSLSNIHNLSLMQFLNPFLFQCTFASKFLTLTESVRDAGDLYLSLKHQPTTFICDSPCGLVRHLEIREPELIMTTQLWQNNCGCFEKPCLDRPPKNVCLFSILNYLMRLSIYNIMHAADL